MRSVAFRLPASLWMAGCVSLLACPGGATLRVAAAATAAGAPPATPKSPECYIRQATWWETVLASREALMALEANEAKAVPPPPAAPKGFKPLRLTLKQRKEPQELKLSVAGLQRLYLGARSEGGAQADLLDCRLVAADGTAIALAPNKPPIAAVAGGGSVKAVKSGLQKGLRISDAELKIDLGGKYDRLEASVVIQKGRNDQVILTAAVEPTVERELKAEARRAAIWSAIERDFATPAEQAEIAAEKDLWLKDWKLGGTAGIAEMARRYAGSCKPAVRTEAQALAKGAAAPADIAKLRAVMQKGLRLETVRAEMEDLSVEAMRLAIRDLMATFGGRYPKGQEFLARLDGLEKELPAIREALAKSDPAAFDQAQRVLAFQREALLANPLLDFDKIVVVKRGLGNLGLVNNWLSNSSAKKDGYDNEIAVLSPLGPRGALKTLYRPEAGRFVGDVDLNFDADRMIFSMPDAKVWHVWEVKADGTGLKRLTPDDQADVDGYDACYLPDGRILFTSTANMQGVPCIGGGGHVANLAQLDPATGKVRMLAFEQDHDWCPAVMNDGTVMYLRWEYTDAPHYFSRLMASMNPDGTNQKALYGSNSYWPNALFFARPVPGHPSKFAGIIGGHHDVPRMGELIVFDAAKGQYEADGVVQRIPGRGKPVPPIIKDGLVGGSWPHFLHPYPLSEKYLLVSRRVSKSGNAPWGIYLVDVFDNMVLLRAESGYALLEPIPLRKTPRPPAIPDKVDTRRKDAIVYMVDVYQGPGLADVPRGKVKQLRVFTYTFGYRGMGGHNCFGVESGWDAKRILGTVPVEADGSALFRVPANTPISVQPLDETGAALQLMRSWMTAMPGEFLSCVGCHETQYDAAVNYQTAASRKGPADIQPWHGPARGLGFLREVQPVLDKHCAGCHDGKDKARPNFADTKPSNRGYAESYHALHRYVRRPGPESDYHMLRPMEYHASTSELVQVLRKGHHDVKLDAEAWDRLLTWMDLNVPYHATWSESRGGKLGAVGDRFRELQKLYAGVEVDPEALPPLPERKLEPIAPRLQPAAKADIPQVAGWPFDATAAASRQQALGQTALTLQLGMTPPRAELISCKPIPPMPVELQLTLIPPGEFVMGSPDGDADERPMSRVKLDKSFWMGVVEVSNAQYWLFDGRHDSRFIDMELKDQETPGYPVNRPEQPVIRVSWQEAMAFCRWLSARTGRRFSLPTEGQWEWACRAGSASSMWFGPRDADFGAFANLADVNMNKFALSGFRPKIAENPSPYHAFIPKVDTVDDKHQVTAPVGSYQANPWGLKDMHGNVAEWTASAYRPYPYNAEDGREDAAGNGRRVVRGGSWFDRPKRATASFRLAYESYQRVHNVGFRVVMEAEPQLAGRKP